MALRLPVEMALQWRRFPQLVPRHRLECRLGDTKLERRETVRLNANRHSGQCVAVTETFESSLSGYRLEIELARVALCLLVAGFALSKPEN